MDCTQLAFLASQALYGLMIAKPTHSREEHIREAILYARDMDKALQQGPVVCEHAPKLRIFVLTFTSVMLKYHDGYAIIVAENENKALEMVKEKFSHDEWAGIFPIEKFDPRDYPKGRMLTL